VYVIACDLQKSFVLYPMVYRIVAIPMTFIDIQCHTPVACLWKCYLLYNCARVKITTDMVRQTKKISE